MKIKDILLKVAVFFSPFVGGFMGALGGSSDGNKMCRRIGIPLMLVIHAACNTRNIFVITICSMMGAISIGYGIPDANDPGSAFGRFWYNLFLKYNPPEKAHHLADMFVRGTIGAIIGVTLLSIPFIRHNWFTYSLGCVGIILTNALISWRNLGSYVLLDKTLSWVETVTWGLITLFGTLIIYL